VDPVSHVALGASLAHVCFGARLGRSAALAGALAGLVPDADILISSATDPLVAVEHHRGFTHALVAVPVGAALVASLWLGSATSRDGRRWLALWGASAISYLSHVLLDAATSYGTQLWWPFSNQRAGWDWIAIVDPVFTLPLIAGLALGLILRRARPAVLALTFAGCYLLIGGVQHGRAVSAQRELARKRGHIPERIEVMPTLGNNVVWRALYIHQGRIHSDRIRVGWFTRPAIREGWSLPLTGAGDLTDDERTRNRRQSFERFAWFSDHWVARSPADASVLADMRYSLGADAFDPIWGIRFTAAGAMNEVEWINRSRDRRINPGELWREITGADERYGQ
jgi:inner membrane protein